MKSLVLLLLFISLVPCQSFSQVNIWKWESGELSTNGYGTYGPKGVAAASNMPSTRRDLNGWRDSVGNLWFFGGEKSIGTGYGLRNDIWKYDLSTKWWTWVAGDNTPNTTGAYGTIGTASPTNKPGAREMYASWQDKQRNFWVFGGDGFGVANEGYLSDLWKYNPSSNQWTWMKGPTTTDNYAVYGTKGVSSAANNPGARATGLQWVDTAGNFWLFGGSGFDGSSYGTMNDLWRYNIATNEWTWISGDNVVNVPGNYGTRGIASPTTKPGARTGSITWTDSLNNLWLFAGSGFGSLGNNGWLCDLWKYSIADNQWTWVKGPDYANASPVYGVAGIGSPANNPGPRFRGSGWTDGKGNLWMFGGYGEATNGGGGLNDMWRYNITDSQWVWMKGDTVRNVYGTYGNFGNPPAWNKPGGRDGFILWADTSKIWLFGGFGYGSYDYGYMNDLWSFMPNYNILPVHLLSFTASWTGDHTLLHWQADNEESFAGYDVERSFDGVVFSKVAALKASGAGHYTCTDEVGNTHGKNIYYRLKMIDLDGHFTYSKIALVQFSPEKNFSLYPNPATSYTNVLLSSSITSKTVNIEIADAAGKVVMQRTYATQSTITVPLAHLPAGVYYIKLIDNTGPHSQTLVITK